MALATETYDDLIALIEALVGANLNQAAHRPRINALINAAAKKAYRESDYWERFLVVGEPRTAKRIAIPDDTEKRSTPDGIVEHTETGIDAIEVTFSTASGTPIDPLGIYRFDTLRNGLQSFARSGKDDNYILQHDGTTTWEIINDDDSAQYLKKTSDGGTTLPTSGWANGTDGSYTTPAIAASTTPAVIDTFLTINRNDPLQRGFQKDTFQWTNTTLGAKLITQEVPDIVYVTYKKRLTDVYGDGTGTTTATIPAEWFQFMAHYAARMWQISEQIGGSDPRVVIADREVQRALEDELMKLETQGIANAVARRIQTHNMENTALY